MHRKFILTYENIRRVLVGIESSGHWDWNLNGVAGTPKAGARIPGNQKGCVATCGQIVHTEILLQNMFESIDELEYSRCHDNGFQYMRGLLSALNDIVTNFHRYHARLQANYIKKWDAAGGGFHSNSRQRSQKGYRGLAEGQKSRLSIITSIHDPELIDINATDTANNISWEEYVLGDFFGDKGGW
ncbi:hypothetical protein E0Z10_g4487 [Xylaria hypoxylon]|uniref:Uncharacterized protein n=1 Tax=Xylaria hypoxylon TaxID=37992 RepID=A0A4Z0YYI3_9PEZI|nr:hypothetical protein E0Z10_g4487 [Xylaria hypoxylon]